MTIISDTHSITQAQTANAFGGKRQAKRQNKAALTERKKAQ